MSETTPSPTGSAGALLKAAREQQGLHLAVLAASLKVTPRKLESLEADRYDELPDLGFARALALSMCRTLRIDAEPVLARLPRQGGEVLDPAMRRLNQPFRDRSSGHDSGQGPGLPSLPLLAAIFLLIAAVVIYVLPAGFWSSLGQGAAEPSASAPGSGSSRPASITGVLGAAMSEAANLPRAAAPDVTQATAPTASTTTSPISETAATDVTASPVIDTVFLVPGGLSASAPPAGGMLSFRAASESWVEVRDGSGQVLFSRTLVAGEAAGLDGSLPMRLTIGNAQGTQVSFRGQPVQLEVTGDNVARLELK